MNDERHPDKRRAQWRDYYYRNREEQQAKSRERQAAKRAAIREGETHEQAMKRREEWNAYARAQYEKKKEDRRAKRNALNERTGIHRSPKTRARVKAWHRVQYYTKPSYRIAQLLRDRLRHALNFARAGKTQRTMALLGCEVAVLLKHLESQWTEGMTWETFGHGKLKWTVDHIRPCASFDLTDPEQQRQAFHYTNLRPMWCIENMSKGSTWNGKRWRHADHAHADSGLQTPSEAQK